MSDSEYKIYPTYIDRSADTMGLYKAEERRSEAIHNCARKWARLMNSNVPSGFSLVFPEDGGSSLYWKIVIPTVLYDLLGSFDKKASELACITLLRNRGYTVEKKPSGGDQK